MRGLIAVSRLVENRVTSIPRQHMSVRPETQGKHAACAVAPSLPHTLADCAPPRPQPHRRFSTVENRPHRPPAPTCVCKHLSGRIPEVAKLHRAIAPPHPRRLCLAAGTVPSPFLDSRKSAAHPGMHEQARVHACARSLHHAVVNMRHSSRVVASTTSVACSVCGCSE